MRYCKNCKQNVESEREIVKVILGTFFTFLAVWFLGGSITAAGIAALIILFILILASEERCPICKASNFGEKPKKKKR